jgi:hypothetical protein
MNPATQHTAIYGPEQVRAAYARLASTYAYVFGPLLNHARLAAVSAVNALPGADVLEAGVGTGLALPYYRAAAAFRAFPSGGTEELTERRAISGR